jgi:hypothetical protein
LTEDGNVEISGLEPRYVPIPDVHRASTNQFWHGRVHADRGHRRFRAAIYELFGASRATDASELKSRTA